MSYRIYTSPGFVVSQAPVGEAGVWLRIFTRDLGLIVVYAAGLRRPGAKMAGHARAPICLKVSLVKGRLGFRLVGAESVGLVEPLLADREVCAGLDRLFKLLNRLLIKEVAEPRIFTDLTRALAAKKRRRPVDWSDLEVILVIRWLHYLGYLPADSFLTPYLNLTSWTTEQLVGLKPQTKIAIATINSSLRASGL